MSPTSARRGEARVAAKRRHATRADSESCWLARSPSSSLSHTGWPSVFYARRPPARAFTLGTFRFPTLAPSSSVPRNWRRRSIASRLGRATRAGASECSAGVREVVHSEAGFRPPHLDHHLVSASLAGRVAYFAYLAFLQRLASGSELCVGVETARPRLAAHLASAIGERHEQPRLLEQHGVLDSGVARLEPAHKTRKILHFFGGRAHCGPRGAELDRLFPRVAFPPLC